MFYGCVLDCSHIQSHVISLSKSILLQRKGYNSQSTRQSVKKFLNYHAHTKYGIGNVFIVPWNVLLFIGGGVSKIEKYLEWDGKSKNALVIPHYRPLDQVRERWGSKF